MPSLRDEQRRLQRAILAHVPFPEPYAQRERAAIYRHAHRARLEGALRANYPKLAQWLGADEFNEIAQGYAAAHPSRHFSLRWHGDELGAFIGRGAIADLARMEWALGEAFDAPDAVPLALQDLGAIGGEECSRLRLALHPSVRVLALDWSVESAWLALRQGLEVRAAEVAMNAHALLVWRRDLDAHWRSATRDEVDALLRLHEAGSLEAACEEMSERDAAEIGTWFAGWVAQEMLVLARASCT